MKIAVKALPLILSAPMALASCQHQKINTRRPLKVQPPSGFSLTEFADGAGRFEKPADGLQEVYGDWWPDKKPLPCPYGKVGDFLYCREAFKYPKDLDRYNSTELESVIIPDERGHWAPIEYLADGTRRDWQHWHEKEAGRYRHARFMPRWASRQTFEITDVAIERIQDISDADAMAEGIERSREMLWRDYSLKNPADGGFAAPRASFISLWQSIYGGGVNDWRENIWVFSIKFKRLPETR